MKRISYFMLAIFLLAGCSQSLENEKVKVEKVIDQYIETINQCDTALVNQIWSHEDYVSFISPSGRYSGYSEIRDKLVVGIFGKNFTDKNLQKKDLTIHIHGNSAWSEFTWTFDAMRKNGKPHHAKGRETQLFEKDKNGKWKLVHIHYSSIKNRN